MKKITKDACDALMNGYEFRQSNTRVTCGKMYLHDNLIARNNINGLFITNAGWFSLTTKERLNGLPNVHIKQVRREWYLNGVKWDGKWIKIPY